MLHEMIGLTAGILNLKARNLHLGETNNPLSTIQEQIAQVSLCSLPIASGIMLIEIQA